MRLPERATAGPFPSANEVSSVLASARRAVFDDPGPAGDAQATSFRSLGGEVFGSALLDGRHVVHAVVFASGISVAGSTATGRSGGSRIPGPDVPGGEPTAPPELPRPQDGPPPPDLR
jgi:hypothetical protein